VKKNKEPPGLENGIRVEEKAEDERSWLMMLRS
jgi:hypothetical protein